LDEKLNTSIKFWQQVLFTKIRKSLWQP